MKKEKDLSRAETACLDYYKANTKINLDRNLFYFIGKEIHESLQPEPWKPKTRA